MGYGLTMLWKKRKKTAEDNDIPGYSYEGILVTVESMTGEDMNKNLAVYDFAIAALGQELAGKSARAIFKTHPSWNRKCIIPVLRGESSCQETINLGHVNIYTLDGGRKRDRTISDYMATYYVELRLLVIVANGLHHSTMKKLLQSGSVKADVVHLTETFDTLHTNGQQWFEDGKPPIPVENFRLAAMYTLAQDRAKLFNERNYWKRKCAVLEEQLREKTE